MLNICTTLFTVSPSTHFMNSSLAQHLVSFRRHSGWFLKFLWYFRSEAQLNTPLEVSPWFNELQIPFEESEHWFWWSRKVPSCHVVLINTPSEIDLVFVFHHHPLPEAFLKSIQFWRNISAWFLQKLPVWWVWMLSLTNCEVSGFYTLCSFVACFVFFLC